MDVQMPGSDGLEGTKRVLQARPECRALVLTMLDLDEYVFGALRAGAKRLPAQDDAAGGARRRRPRLPLRRHAVRAVGDAPARRDLRAPAAAPRPRSPS